MPSFNWCFLTCIQIFQEAGQVVWYLYLLKNFPQFVVIHTVKGFGVVNIAEVDVFLELSCFFNDPTDVGNLISSSSASGAAKSLHSCLTPCDLIHSSPPGFSVPGILQVRILEWVAMPSSRGSSQTRDRSCLGSLASPALAGGFFTTSTTWEAQKHLLWLPSPQC